MATIKKNQKLCWNCEGEVDKDAIVCLFCGADLSVSVDTPASSPYKTVLAPETKEPSPSAAVKEEVMEKPQEESSSLIAMLFLLPGIVFLLFALLLVFFASDGSLILRWNSNTWYLYALAALPLFYFGYRLLP